MKKILISTFTIFAAVVAVAGATAAVFSDTSSFIGNTISTATVNIDARSEARGDTIGKPLVASGLVPGEYTNYARGIVYNESNSSDVRVFMYVNNFSGSCGKTNLKVWTGHAANGASSERDMVLYDGALSGLQGNGQRVEITGSGKVFNPTIPPDTSAVIQQRGQLDPTANNSYQGTSCTWDEVFVAENPTP